MLDPRTDRQRKYRVNNTWIFNNTANPPPLPGIPDGNQDISVPYFPKHEINKQFIAGIPQVSMPAENQSMIWSPPIPRMEERRLNYSFDQSTPRILTPFIGDNQTSILIPSIPRIERRPLHQHDFHSPLNQLFLTAQPPAVPKGEQDISVAYYPKRRLNNSFTQSTANLPVEAIEALPDGNQWLEHLPLTRPNSNVYQDWSYRLPDSFIFVVDFSGVVGYYDRVKFPTYEETLPYPVYNESLEHPQYKDNVRWP